MVVPFEVLFESFVRRVFLLDVQPRQVRLGVLGARLVLCRFPWSRLDLGNRLFNHPVDKRKCHHARISQVILLLVLVEDWYPVWLRLLNKDTTPLDGCLFALQVPCAPRTGDVRNLVTCVINDDILVVTEKVRVQKVLDTLHCAIAIRLLLDKDRVRLHRPLFSAKVCFQRLEQTIGVLWRNTRHVPLTYQSGSRIDETHRKVLYPYIDTQDQRHPFIKDLETFKLR